MAKTWTLIFMFHYYYDPLPLVVNDFVSEQSCLAAANYVLTKQGALKAFCIVVDKPG